MIDKEKFVGDMLDFIENNPDRIARILSEFIEEVFEKEQFPHSSASTAKVKE